VKTHIKKHPSQVVHIDILMFRKFRHNQQFLRGFYVYQVPRKKLLKTTRRYGRYELLHLALAEGFWLEPLTAFYDHFEIFTFDLLLTLHSGQLPFVLL
jgi:hypothetical protein